MDLDILAQFVETVINNGSVTVIINKQQAASPAKPYAAVNLISETPLGFPVSETVDQGGTVDQVIAQAQIGQAEVIFYSNDLVGGLSARNLAKNFLTSLGTSRAKTFQSDNGFGVMGTRPIIDADIERGGDIWERRSIVEFGINFIDCIEDVNVPFFEESGLEITLNEA
jgi:hypothetical protein